MATAGHTARVRIVKVTLVVILSFVCLLVAGFCVFGFLATFEPGVRHAMTFRLAYGVIGLGSLAAVIAMAARSLRSRR